MSKYGHRPHNWFEAIINKLGGEEAAEAFLRNELVVQAVSAVTEVFEILVDYSLTFEEMIAAGRYDWVNSDITAKRFPVKGEGEAVRKAYLVHFNRNMTSDEVIRELDKQGKRPATIEELLAFGAKYPEIQRKFPVVALGSSARVLGFRYVAYLRGDVSKRGLDLSWWDDAWHGRCRFIAFDK